jgi:hypothetical protein
MKAEMTQPQFDPSVIELYAAQLYRRADSVRVGSVVTGAVLGVVFGAVPVSPLGPYLPIPSSFGLAMILLGALIGGFLGYAIGEGRSFRIRLQAQMVLFQLQLERNTAAATHAAVAAPAPVLPSPAPQAAPILALHQAVPPPPPVAAPEPLIPVQPAAPLTPPPVVPAPPPVLAPRPTLEAVPPLEPAEPLAEREPLRAADELAPLLPPLSPSANSNPGA